MVLVSDREVVDDVLHLDRRRAPRVEQARPVKVYEPAASRFFGGRTRNVSSTGIQVEFPSFVQLRPGRLVNVHIGIHEGGQPLANRRSMVPARVVWMNADPNADGTLVVGLEFLTFVSARAA
jgi:hypothetical protein